MNAHQLDRLDAKAQRVLEILERWDDRFNGRQNQKRKHPRQSLTTRVAVYVPVQTSGNAAPEELALFWGWARNISRSGMCFIHDRIIPADEVIIGLSPAEDALHFRARIVRRRQVHDGFWEYGAELISRVDLPKSFER